MIRNFFGRFASWTGFLAVLFASLLFYATISVPHFASAFNLSQAAAGVSEKAILLLPMALLIIAREIDLSVASILAFTSVVLGVLMRAHVSLVAAIPLVLLAGAAAGSLNGLLVTGLNLPSLLVTLGTMALFRGIGYIMLGTHSVNELPDELTNFGINTVGASAVPWTIVPFVILAPVFAIVLHYTALGRRIYAIGGNPDVALYTGIRVRLIRFGLFVVSGLMCALADPMRERIMRLALNWMSSPSLCWVGSAFSVDAAISPGFSGRSGWWRSFVTSLGSIGSVAMGRASPSDCCSSCHCC